MICFRLVFHVSRGCSDALASVASAIILVLGGQGKAGVSSAIALAIPLAVAGLLLTIIARTLATLIVHIMTRS